MGDVLVEQSVLVPVVAVIAAVIGLARVRALVASAGSGRRRARTEPEPVSDEELAALRREFHLPDFD